MKKFTKILALALTVLFVISTAACATETAPAGDGEEAPYHIGIVTLSTAQAEDELRGAEACLAAFGDAREGGMIRHIVQPDSFSQELETVIANIAGLADDPLMKAIIVNPAVQGTAAGFQRVREVRDDIILIAGQPQDDPLVIAEVADFCVSSDNFVRGYFDIVRAKNMGAEAFIHMSFPRHMGQEPLSRRRNMFEEACKDFGIKFVDVTVPDPTGDIGIPGAQQTIYDMMPQLIDEHGVNSVYFTTNTALHDPIIQRVAEYGAMFVCTDDVSPLVGYPTGLGVDLSAEAGDWDAILNKIEAAGIEQGLEGRMGIFKYSLIYLHSEGLVRVAKDMIDGVASEDTMQAVLDAYGELTGTDEWLALPYEDAATGNEISNYYTIAQDVYIFGEGMTGVMSEEIPAKYYDIK